jgi:hypothetical protein
MLDCGVRLPASTGSDWFVCSANRVYSQTGGEFRYEQWLQGLRGGQTFITNGPAIHLKVDGCEPGATVHAKPGATVEAEVSWSSHYNVETVEAVSNGKVVARRSFPRPPGEGKGESRRGGGPTSGSFKVEVPVRSSGWVAARLGSTLRDSFAQPLWAHTSPVYIEAGSEPGPERMESAAWFVEAIDRSMEWVRAKGRFYTDAQRKEVHDLFRAGQDVYWRLRR